MCVCIQGCLCRNDAPALSSSSPRLDLWPGFVTSILQYEESIMLGADVSHKIMRADTVYDTLNELHGRARDDQFHDMAVKMLVGEIVLTRYILGECLTLLASGSDPTCRVSLHTIAVKKGQKTCTSRCSKA